MTDKGQLWRSDLAELRRPFPEFTPWGLAPEIPAKGIRFSVPAGKHGRGLTYDEGRRVLEADPANANPGVILALHAGIRRGERLSP